MSPAISTGEESMSLPLLDLKNVTKVFSIGGGLAPKKTIKALDSVSFTMPSDKTMITTLVGESGSGKTTLARIVLGLIEPSSGEVLYKGRNVADWLKKNRMEFLKEVQPIFQDPYGIYNPFHRVERVLEIVIKKFKLASNKAEMQEKIVNTMKEIGLRPEELLGRYPHQLSGGERQRFMLTRILLMRPKLIVADEPVSMIDASLRAIFLNQLLSFREKLDSSCLYITHDLNIASYVADKILVLCHGRIVEEAPKDALITDPLHPYTQALVNSIAIPDPKKRWKEKTKSTPIESFNKLKAAGRGCVFSNRCAYAKKECKEKAPPLLEVEPERMVACFLYSKN